MNYPPWKPAGPGTVSRSTSQDYSARLPGRSDFLLWADLEMDDVSDVKDGHVLEIALVLTDKWLNVRDTYKMVVGVPTAELKLSGWSQAHHTASRLLQEVSESKRNIGVVDLECEAFLAKHVRPGFTFTLCGSTIFSDRRFIDAHMPALSARLHYRMIDISGTEAVVNMTMPWLRKVFPKKRSPEHRAMPDVMSSIDLQKCFYIHLYKNCQSSMGVQPARYVR